MNETTTAATAEGGTERETTKWVGAGFALGLVGYLILPIVLGPAACFCGYKAYKGGSELTGLLVVVWGLASALLGTLLGLFWLLG